MFGLLPDRPNEIPLAGTLASPAGFRSIFGLELKHANDAKQHEQSAENEKADIGLACVLVHGLAALAAADAPQSEYHAASASGDLNPGGPDEQVQRSRPINTLRPRRLTSMGVCPFTWQAGTPQTHRSLPAPRRRVRL